MASQRATAVRLKDVIKKFARRVASVPVVNGLVRRALKPFVSILPESILRRIPVVGLVPLRLPNLTRICLETRGGDHIAPLLYWRGIDGFEPGTIRLFIHLLKCADTVLDIGAYTGLYSLIAAADNPARAVYAFEPVPAVRECLKTNVERNRLRNIRVESSAVTDHEGSVDLYIGPGVLPAESSLLQGFRKGAEIISVPAVTVDSFVAANGISRVDLIKVDTEATEHLVLRGARDVIRRDRPTIICEVLKGLTETDLHSVLDGLGYRYFWITGKGLVETRRIEGDETYKNMNYLFVADRRLPEVLGDVSRGYPDIGPLE